METHNKLKVFRYEDSEESIKSTDGPVVFLAGPTVRVNQPHLTSWRFEAIEIFKQKNFAGSLIVPEFSNKEESDKEESDKGKKWIPMWEFNGLKRADCIMFWIPRTKELIGLTTNWEHGYWMGKDVKKIAYGRPDDAYRIGYLDIMWEAINEGRSKDLCKIHNTLSDTVNDAISNAISMHIVNEAKKRLL